MSKRFTSLSAILASALLVGCGVPSKFTGGGTMHSAGGDSKAVFTFNADSCNEDDVKGNINFHDKSAINFADVNGVKLRGDVVSTYYCSDVVADLNSANPECACDAGYQEVNFTYDSTNQRAPGEGEGVACLADFGEHGGVRGMAIIQVNSGPYMGYTNIGTVEGNAQRHACPSE